MTARVVFVDRAKQLAIAVLWLLAFAGVALGVGFVLYALTTGIGGATWWLARDGAPQRELRARDDGRLTLHAHFITSTLKATAFPPPRHSVARPVVFP